MLIFLFFVINLSIFLCENINYENNINNIIRNNGIFEINHSLLELKDIVNKSNNNIDIQNYNFDEIIEKLKDLIFYNAEYKIYTITEINEIIDKCCIIIYNV